MSIIDQKEYLKKYLSLGDEKEKNKKRKKRAKVIRDRVKIIDDDIDLPTNYDETELKEFLTAEDAPQVVGIVDDRPLALRIDDYRKSDKWKLVGSDEELKEKENTITKNSSKMKFNKNRQTGQSDSDASPVRTKVKIENESPSRNNYDSDISPPRKSRKNYDSDASPPRKSRLNADISPPRQSRKKYDSDASPPRKSRLNADSSPSRISRKHLDTSPPRKSKNKMSLRLKESIRHDTSPPRKSRRNEHLDKRSPTKRNNDSGASPPRKSNRNDSDTSPFNKSKRLENRSSPHISKTTNPSNFKSKRTRESRFSDIIEVPQNSTHKSDKHTDRSESSNKISKYNSDSSPVRKTNKTDERKDISSKKVLNKNPVDKTKKMTKTLDGKTAGLQYGGDFKKETAVLKKREDEMFENMSAEISGKDAAPIMRDRKTGKIRDLEKEVIAELEKQQKENVQKEKYDKWGKGLKQVEEHREKVEQDLHEMSKPFARYANDEDLEKYLKDQERDGDPMLQYIRKKKRKQAVASGDPVALKPRYEGDFIPNRFGIPPGFRWDGVDRSSGYEKQWFEVQNSKKAVEEEVYKWSTEDM